jgi:hypothetical protein
MYPPQLLELEEFISIKREVPPKKTNSLIRAEEQPILLKRRERAFTPRKPATFDRREQKKALPPRR